MQIKIKATKGGTKAGDIPVGKLFRIGNTVYLRCICNYHYRSMNLRTTIMEEINLDVDVIPVRQVGVWEVEDDDGNQL